MTLRRTSDTLSKKRYGPDGRVEFDRGVRTTNDYDAETEEWAARNFDELEVDGADEAAQSDETTVEDEAARVVLEREEGEDADNDETEE